MSSFLEKNILITGGSGGIGKLLAQNSIREGAAHVILWDLEIDKLNALMEREEIPDRNIHVFQVDISQPKQIYDTAEMILSDFGPIDLLFNNAGIVTGKEFTRLTVDDIEYTVKVNLLGMMHTTRAFLPVMIKHKSGHIINISSAVSLMANPKMTVYAGTKWGVTGWSESLRIELNSAHPNLHVTTIQPGYIDTGMFEGVTSPLFTPILKQDYITDKIIKAVKKNKNIVREPFMVKLIPFLRGNLPASIFDFLAGKIFGVYRSMDTFTGK